MQKRIDIEPEGSALSSRNRVLCVVSLWIDHPAVVWFGGREGGDTATGSSLVPSIVSGLKVICVVLSCISYYQCRYMMWCFMFSVHIYRLILRPPVKFFSTVSSFLKCNVAVERYDQFVGFEVLTALSMNIYILRDVASIRPVDIFGRFRRIYCFHF